MNSPLPSVAPAAARIPFGMPTPPIWLDHAAVISADLESALDFYVRLIGLQLAGVTTDVHNGHRVSALLCDTDGHCVLEIIEIPDTARPTLAAEAGVRHLAFRLPRAYFHSLRTRLEANDHPYQFKADKLFVHDPDGALLIFSAIR